MFPFASRLPPEDRRAYMLDAVAAAFYGVFIGICNPFVPVILKRLGASPFEMGLSLAAPFLAMVIGFPLYRFMGGFRALDLVTVPTFFSRLVVLGIGLASTPRAILTAFVAVQFVESLGMSAWTRVLKEIYSPRGRSPAMGFVRFFLGGAMILATAVGGVLMDRGHTFLPFLVAGLSGSISSLIFSRVLPRDRSPVFSLSAIATRDIVRTLSTSEAFFWLNVTVLFYGFGNLLVLGTLPTMLVERFQISNTALGYLNGLTNVLQTAGYLGLGLVLTRLGGIRGLLLGMLVGIANPWIFLLAPRLELLAIPYALNGIVFASFDLTWPVLILTLAPEAEIGLFAAVYTLHMGIRGLIAMFLSNLVLPVLGTGFFFGLGGVLMALGLAVGYLLLDRWESPATTRPA